MHRRTLLRAAPVLALTGCLGGGDGGDDPPRVTDRSFEDTGACSNAGTATVDTGGSTVSVDGCITGPNGCAVAALDSAIATDGDLEVVVTTERGAPPDVACTEALVSRSYTATVALGGEVASVRVIHDTPGGRQMVAEA